VLGDAKWKAWLKAVAANGPELTDSDSTSYAAVLRGDRPVCICDYSDYVSTPGTPLAVDYYGQGSNGVVVQPIVAVVAAAAPHPAMAALFINWMLSPTGGEKAMAQSGRAPAVPVPGFAQIEMPAQVKTMPIYGVLGSFFANATTYTSVFQSIFG
jgi:ABC-type Fe3+ transport system substrate-binding protein